MIETSLKYSANLTDAQALLELVDQVLVQQYEINLNGHAFIGLSLVVNQAKLLISQVEEASQATNETEKAGQLTQIIDKRSKETAIEIS